MQKRPLSYSLTTPISSPPPHSQALVHATTLPLSLLTLSQTPHCILPIMPVLHWCVPGTFEPSLMLSHCTGQPKSGPLFGSLTHTLTLRPLVPSSPDTHRHTQTHTQGLFSAGTQGRGCNSDNRPTLPRTHKDKLRSFYFGIKLILCLMGKV